MSNQNFVSLCQLSNLIDNALPAWYNVATIPPKNGDCFVCTQLFAAHHHHHTHHHVGY